MQDEELQDLLTRYLASDGRERKQLLKEILPHATEEIARRMAPTIRDNSPRVAARVTALLARHGLDELFESLLEGLKPGKIAVLRTHYRKIRGNVPEPGRGP